MITLAHEAASLNTAEIVIGLLGGLALFLFGLERMAAGLKTAASEAMKTVLATLTSNRFTGLLTGILVTAAVQSSSVTTVLLVGFISAGLMTMNQSIGVILGAHIGTTITAQVIAFKVTKLALLMIAIGFAVSYVPRCDRLRPYARVLMALGLVFLGMNVMGDAAAPLRGHEGFLQRMASMDAPLTGIIVGAIFTAIVQSSAATIGIIIMLAGQGLISLPAGIALALGANIGTCVTALLAAIGKPREAVRAALVHVLFNTAGVALWVAFIGQLADLVVAVSPGEAVEGVAAARPRHIANAHTIFNVANSLIFIWFTTPFAWVVRRLVPERPEAEPPTIRSKHLDDSLIKTPALAMASVRQELRRMGRRVDAMLQAAPGALLHGSAADLARVAAMDDDIDKLHGFIITYLGKISRQELSQHKSQDLVSLMAAVNYLEHIGDTVETNLVTLGRQRVERGVAVSQETSRLILDVAGLVRQAIELAVRAAVQRDVDAARRVIAMKRDVGRLVDSAYEHQARRLVADEPNRLDLYTIETDAIENLKRIYYFAKRIAKTIPGAEPNASSATDSV